MVDVTSNAAMRTLKRSNFAGNNLTFFGVLRSESFKFRTLGINWLLTLITIAVMVGIAATFALVLNNMAASAESAARAGQNMAENGFGTQGVETMAYAIGGAGVDMANMLIAAIAVIFIGTEYATRQITTTLTVAPKRSQVYFAKLVFISVFALVVGFVSASLSYAAGFPLLDKALSDSMEFTPGVVLNWFAVGLYFMFIAWLGLGFGALLRSSAGGIVLVVVLLFILPIIATLLNGAVDWIADAQQYLPSQLGRMLISYDLPADSAMTYVESGLWFTAIAAAVVLLGWLRIRFTDSK